MADTVYQDVFNRIFTYLRESGVEMTAERYRSLLRLIDDAVADSGQSADIDRLMPLAMARLPDYFQLPVVAPPEAFPPIRRRSVGYVRPD
ncbi:hypothetical protein [Marinobacter sp. C2H3]|uniref:hypothetical protein n=1 Tax=Marinobacter sp. C2H3 TaxID=3119003 RepID=UPI00300EA960